MVGGGWIACSIRDPIGIRIVEMRKQSPSLFSFFFPFFFLFYIYLYIFIIIYVCVCVHFSPSLENPRVQMATFFFIFLYFSLLGSVTQLHRADVVCAHFAGRPLSSLCKCSSLELYTLVRVRRPGQPPLPKNPHFLSYIFHCLSGPSIKTRRVFLVFFSLFRHNFSVSPLRPRFDDNKHVPHYFIDYVNGLSLIFYRGRKGEEKIS